MKGHYPHTSGGELPEREYHILHTYASHYLAIDEPVNPRDINPQKLPSELHEIIDLEAAGDIRPLYWIELAFRPNFSAEDLDDMLIAINTFPVSNKKYRKRSIAKDQLEKAFSLPSDVNEKLLAVDSVIDSANRAYQPDTLTGSSGEGTYHLEIIRDLSLNGRSLIDHIEQLLDLIDAINEAADVELPIEFREARAGDVKYSMAAIERAYELLAYKPIVGFKEGIACTYEWYEETHV